MAKPREQAYSIRAYPTPKQAQAMIRNFGCVRWVYNHFLALLMAAIKDGNPLTYYCEWSKALTALKNEYPWLREADSTSLQSSLKNLQRGIENYFRGKKTGVGIGFPKFKKKKERRKAYTSKCVGTNIEVSGNAIKLPKIGWVKCKISKQMHGRILSATVSINASGNYFISVICTDVEFEEFKKTGKSVGIDLGIRDFAVTSDGVHVENPGFLKKSLAKLNRAQQELARKQKGSANYEKARLKVAKLNAKIANQRKDFTHKLSTGLVKDNDIICAEDLDVKEMQKTRWLAKLICDVPWGEFLRQLKYKCERHGRAFVQTDKVFPSSQVCSACGHLHPAVKDLKVRKWVCPECGTEHQRDENAAKNILSEGLRLLEAS